METLNELSMITEGKRIWGEVDGEYGSVLPMVYMTSEKTELNHAWYAIWQDVVDSLLWKSDMREAAGMLIEYPGMKVEKL